MLLGVAAPVRPDDELELTIDSLAYGGNGVARLDGFVVFVRRGPSRRHGARARDEGAAQPRRGDRDRGRRDRRRRASTRRARTTRRAAAAASRISPTRRSSPPRTARVEDSLARIGRPRRAAARADRRRPSRVFHYRNKMEYSFAPDRRRAGARPPPRRALGRGARDRALLADDRPRQRDPQHDPRLGARGEARRRTTRRRSRATCATSSCARAGTPARRSSSSSRTRGERFDRERLIEVLTAFPEVRSIHWAVNDTPAEVTNLPTRAALGRGRDRGGARRPALPRPPERVPADEHARWPSGSTSSRARRGG